MTNLLKYLIFPLVASGSFMPHFTSAPVLPGEIMSTGKISNANISLPTPSVSVYTGSMEAGRYIESRYYRFSPSLLSLGIKKGDDSIDTYVSRRVSLSDKEYAPLDLVPIAHQYISEEGRNSKLRLEAAVSLWRMAEDFYREFQAPLVVISGYRSAAYQQRMWNLGKCSATLCAPSGFSEHQLGLAIDIFDATTEGEYLSNKIYAEYVLWLQSHAHLYGYHQSYQKGEAIDGYEVEPWHWRYLGVDLATKLKNLGWTFTEYRKFEETMKTLR